VFADIKPVDALPGCWLTFDNQFAYKPIDATCLLTEYIRSQEERVLDKSLMLAYDPGWMTF